jgi:probable rRNA maturation factor
MHRVNLAHLKHDYPTDVLSFLLSEGEGPLEGEVLVGVERAIENAKAYGRTAEDEIRLYVVHGLLHLVGYDDKRPAEARRMARRQEELLETAGSEGRKTALGRRGARGRSAGAGRARGVEKS